MSVTFSKDAAQPGTPSISVKTKQVQRQSKESNAASSTTPASASASASTSGPASAVSKSSFSNNLAGRRKAVPYSSEFYPIAIMTFDSFTCLYQEFREMATKEPHVKIAISQGKHPPKCRCDFVCQGFYMDVGNSAYKRHVSLLTAERNFFDEENGASLKEKLIKKFKDSSIEDNQPVHSIKFRVPGMNTDLCHLCYAHLAGFLSTTDEGIATVPFRQKSTWSTAAKAHTQPGSTSVATGKVSASVKESPIAENMTAYIRVYASKESGYAEQTTENDDKHLASTSRAAMYDTYKKSCSDETLHGTYGYFCQRISEINKDKEDITVRLGKRYSTQAKCATCIRLRKDVDSANATKDTFLKAKARSNYQEHLRLAKDERIAYRTRANAGSMFESTWSFGLDGFDSFKCRSFMYKGQQLKDMKGAQLAGTDAVTYKTTGVIVHGYGNYFYLAQPYLPGNANFNLHCLHATLIKQFDRVQKGEIPHPRVGHIQVDGGTDNKCEAFFKYCAWLIMVGAFEHLTVSFLLVGHTHDDYDGQFVPITWALRHSVVNSIYDLKRIIEVSCTNDGRFALQGVDIVNVVPDFTQFVNQDSNAFAGYKGKPGTEDKDRPHHFIYERAAAGQATLRYRNFTQSGDWDHGIELLASLPDATSMKAQAPVILHLNRLAMKRRDVLSTFAKVTKLWGSKYFSETDEAHMTGMFNLFCAGAGLNGGTGGDGGDGGDGGANDEKEHIEDIASDQKQLNLAPLEQLQEREFKFKVPPSFDYVTEDAIMAKGAVAGKHNTSAIRPITHSQYTSADKKAEKKEAAKKEAEKKEAEWLIIRQEEEMAGAMAMEQDKAFEERERNLLQEAETTNLQLRGDTADGAAAKKYLADMDASTERTRQFNQETSLQTADTVGMLKTENDDIFLLLDWNDPGTDWHDHPQKVHWTDTSDITNLVPPSFDAKDLVVWWGGRNKRTTILSPYAAHVLAEKDGVASLLYEDGDRDELTLTDLSVTATGPGEHHKVVMLIETGYITPVVQEAAKTLLEGTKYTTCTNKFSFWAPPAETSHMEGRGSQPEGGRRQKTQTVHFSNTVNQSDKQKRQDAVENRAGGDGEGEEKKRKEKTEKKTDRCKHCGGTDHSRVTHHLCLHNPRAAGK